ncbi:hypothetical protein CLOP_g14215, partial [Closterium sp. NIES-67]|jgi:hypothetical protein
MQYN